MVSFLALFLALFLAACAAGEAARKEATPPAPSAAALPAPAATPVRAAPSPARAGAPPAAAPIAAKPAYPPSKREDVADLLHGVRVEDPYRWLEEMANPEVKSWLSAQAQLARAQLDALPRRNELVARIKELAYVDTISAPVHRGTRYFYLARTAAQEKSVVYWHHNEGEPHTLLDPNTWSADGSVALGHWEASWDGRWIAYKERPNNSDEASIKVRSVEDGKPSPIDTIPGGKYGGISWKPDGSGFYYTWIPPPDPKVKVADRPGLQEIRFHALGQDPAEDPVVRAHNGDPRSFVQAELSRDGRYLVLSVAHGWRATDIYVQDLREKKPAFKPVLVGRDARYDAFFYQGRLFLQTNDGAPMNRVIEVDWKKPARAAFRDILPERKNALLKSATLLGGKLVAIYEKDVVQNVEVHDLDGRLLREQPLPAPGIVSDLEGNEDSDEAYLEFESFTYPREVHRFFIQSGKDEVTAKLKVPVDPSLYAVEQLFFASKDQTRVPMFVVHRKDLKKDGSAPALLYGYGGFLSGERPTFRGSLFAWLEQGGVYAVANLRGGDEYGEAWHRAGMGLQKQNVFDDFAAAAQALVKEGYTKPERLALRGGSNGGLLVGALITQHPELFRVALCGVPLIDMVRYHLFGSGKTWVEEYGSAEDPVQFKSILAWSPMQHVVQGTRYPATLILSADADDRVDPMHARKFAAALQWATTDGPVLLRLEKNSGHGGADLLRAAVERTADEYAFALAQMDLAATAP